MPVDFHGHNALYGIFNDLTARPQGGIPRLLSQAFGKPIEHDH